jgi:hypothetical protein
MEPTNDADSTLAGMQQNNDRFEPVHSIDPLAIPFVHDGPPRLLRHAFISNPWLLVEWQKNVGHVGTVEAHALPVDRS